jgi:hypothetical protein
MATVSGAGSFCALKLERCHDADTDANPNHRPALGRLPDDGIKKRGVTAAFSVE